MDFLNFGLLPYFLPLAAIPIVLHLLTLHRLKTVELSTFRFLFDSYVQQRRRMKFLEALIAFLRTLFLLLIILSIARPVVQHWDSLFGMGGKSGRDIVMLMDCSASMAAATDGVTALDRAKRAALEVVDRMGGEDRVTILRISSQPQEVCTRFSSSAKTLKSEIESLHAAPSRSNLFAAFSHVFGAEGRQLNNPLVYVFSDLQSSGWREFSEGEGNALVPEETEVIVVNVGSNQEIPNLAVLGDGPSGRAIAGLPITLQPRVGNYSTTDEEVSISVLVDEKEIAQKKLLVKAGETAEAEIIFTPQPGVWKGRYEIASDRFTDDDAFLFTLAVAPQVNVALVNGNPNNDPMENEAVYLKTAMIASDADDPTESISLDGEGEADPRLEAQRQFVRALAVKEIPEGALNADVLEEADVVVLANCGRLNQKHFDMLSMYVYEGGGLIILPGDRVKSEVYNKKFFPAPQLPDEMLIAAELGELIGDPNNSSTFEHIGAVDFAHPVFSVFAGSDQRYLRKVNVYRRFALSLAEDRGGLWPLAELTDGSPALLESRFGAGRVLLSAFEFHTKGSNLPLKPEFVPLVLRMVGHVKRQGELEGPSVVPADGLAEFVAAPSWAPASGKVTDIAGRTTPVAFQRSNSQLVGAFERTIEKGFYDVEVKGGRAEQAKNGKLAFAVNVAEEESQFVSLTGPQVKSAMPDAKVTIVDASSQAQQQHGGLGNRQEVWRPLIWLTFIVIAVEFMLATLGGQTIGGEGASTGERIRDIAQGRMVGRMTGADMPELSRRN